MRARYLLIGLVVVLTVVTGVLIYQGNRTGTTASESPVTITQTATAAATGTVAPAGDRAASNVPMTKLKPGDTAPQFIIFSFDGAGSHTKWQEFLAAAATTNSRFNGFLTGLYLLADENRNRYTGPGHAPGKSSVGFGGTTDEIASLIGDLNQAYAAGHEIGTHYNHGSAALVRATDRSSRRLPPAVHPDHRVTRAPTTGPAGGWAR